MDMGNKFQVVGPYDLLTVLDFECKVEANNHAKAFYRGILSDPQIDFSEPLSGNIVSVNYKKALVFEGLISEIRFDTKNTYTECYTELVSGTIILDQTKRYRSFQNVNLTYRDVINLVISDYSSAAFIFNIEDRRIGRPLIQYAETDWEFIKRIVSHLGATIYPSNLLARPVFYVGMPKGSEIDYDNRYEEYTTHIDEADTEKVNLSWILEKKTPYIIGDYLASDGLVKWVSDLKIFYEDAELLYRYHLADKKMFERYENEKLRSISITGQVIDRKEDQLKLHLTIDEEQSIEEAFWFYWKPITGNLTYIMPELGTMVTLFFIDTEFSNAKSMFCLRTPQSLQCVDMKNYRQKGVRTHHRKRLLLYPEKMGYISETGNNDFMLEDTSGANIITPRKLMIQANEDISFSADTVYIYSPSVVGMHTTNRSNQARSSVDFSGPVVNVRSNSEKTYLDFSGRANALPAKIAAEKSIDLDVNQDVLPGIAVFSTVSDLESELSEASIQKVLSGLAFSGGTNLSGAGMKPMKTGGVSHYSTSEIDTVRQSFGISEHVMNKTSHISPVSELEYTSDKNIFLEENNEALFNYFKSMCSPMRVSERSSNLLHALSGDSRWIDTVNNANKKDVFDEYVTLREMVEYEKSK